MSPHMSTPPVRFLILPNVSERPQDTGEADIVVIRQPFAWAEAQYHLAPGRAAIMPIVDITGTYPDADVSIDAFSAALLAEAFWKVEPILARIALLPASVFTSRDPWRWLLARLAVRAAPLEPVPDAHSPFYAEARLIPDIAVLAEQLADLGLLTRHVRDRRRVCPQCGSAPLIVHAESMCYCGTCGFQGDVTVLADSPLYAYELTEAGRTAAFSAMSLYDLIPGADERKAFVEQMRQCVEDAGESSGLLRVQVSVRKADFPSISLRQLQQRVYDSLLPLARPYIFASCVIGHFSDHADVLRDSLPHLRDILSDIDADLHLELIYPQDVLMLAEFEAILAQSVAPMP